MKVIHLSRDQHDACAAAKHGDLETLRRCLQAGASPNTVKDEQPLANIAIVHNQPACLAELIDRGLSVAARDQGGETALHAAAKHGRAECAELLIAAGANPNARGYDGTTPLHDAAFFGHSKLVDALLGAGADLHATDEFKRSALHQTVRGHMHGQNSVDGNCCLVKLLNAGADMEAKDHAGETPLMFAADAGSTKDVRILASRGARLDEAQSNGWTASMFSASVGKIDCLRALVGSGADLDRVNSKGRTAAEEAKLRGHSDCVEFIHAAQLARAEKAALSSIAHERAQPTKRVPARSL